MGILQNMARLIEEFQALPDWETRYKKIIDRAKRLTPMPEALKTEDNKVRGCSSTVWLHADFDGANVTYLADSDAVLVRGLVALLLEVYSGHPPDEIIANPPVFIEEMGLNVNLSPNRANGLTAMVKQITLYALAFKARPKPG
jgi:cysteine desulfuration protein SufE